MYKIIKKYDGVVVFAILLVILCISSFSRVLDVNDELWNFSNVYKMSNGFTIYKECNVIITPLFFYVGNILFKIFGANYLVFRIYGLLINVFLYLAIYKLFKTLNIRKGKSFLYTFSILNITRTINFFGANYNNLAILLAIIGIILMLKKKSNIIQGIIIFLIFMTKQNIGIYYALGISLYKFWAYKDIKRTVKEIGIEFISVIILFSSYLLYLHFSGNLYYFIDMTFCGVSEFAQKNIFIQVEGLLELLLLAVILVFSYIVIVNKKINISEEKKDTIRLLFCVGLTFNLISYPLFNTAHIVLGSIFSIICFIYVMESILLSDILRKSKVINVISIIVVGIFAFVSICLQFNNLVAEGNIEYAKPYLGVKVLPDTGKDIDEICNYVKKNDNNGINTIILSCNADLYMNMLNRTNNKFDLPFLGNLGSEGENGIINELKNLKNTQVLLLKDGMKYQESEKIWNFVADNFKKIGEVGNYYIYVTSDMQ